MSLRFLPIVVASVLVVAASCSTQAETANPEARLQDSASAPTNAKPTSLRTSDGVEFLVLGDKPTQPAPTLFIFALDAERTLASDYYRQAGDALSKRGYVCVSLDLPCHGSQRRINEAAELKGWRERIDNNEDLMSEFTARAKKVLDHLIAEGYTDPNRVAACGTSRGGFAACHLVAADPRVRCAAAYIPVTDLMALREFRGAEDSALANSLSLQSHVDTLAQRGVWIGIGDRDDRVGTDRAVEFARALSATAAKNPARNIVLFVASVQGHKTPPGAAEQSAEWIARTLDGR